jgi:predicted PurR-regulated permease PerM
MPPKRQWTPPAAREIHNRRNTVFDHIGQHIAGVAVNIGEFNFHGIQTLRLRGVGQIKMQSVIANYGWVGIPRLDDLIVQFSFGKQVKAMRIVRKAEEKLGGWLRGQLALSLIIGLAAYILLSALNIPYALPLAVLAGIMEVVPVIGPIVSAIPAILIAYISAPFSAIWVALGYFVIQQLENHLVVPQVMKYSVGLNPLVVILAVAIGGRLLGISGALLAVPITVVVQIIIEEVLREEQQ